MGYVWLRYIWKNPTDVEAVASPDWKTYRPIKLMVEFWDVFLCKKVNAKKYKKREFQGDMDNNWDMPIYYWITESKDITHLNKQMYYRKWKIFEKKKWILLHYLYEIKSDYLFGASGRCFYIDFNNIFSWILWFHQKYLSSLDVPPLNFDDILESFDQGELIICHEMKDRITWDKSLKITLLDWFFVLPEIIEQKNIYETQRAELLEQQNKGILKYWDICFNLNDRTLEIWHLRWKDAIKTIDSIHLLQTNLEKRTPTAIMLLYCIIEEANRWNFEIKDNLTEYKDSIERYRLKLWINNNKIPSDFATYLSSVRTLLKQGVSEYKITNRSTKSKILFKKIDSNKSS